MKCPVCGIEMVRISPDTWKCRNPRCPAKQARPGESAETEEDHVAE